MTGALRHLLVDARPIDHPTARGRGIARYVSGLLWGLDQIDAPFTALVGSEAEAELLTGLVGPERVRPWSPAAVREVAEPGTWYLATQLFLHPVALDPIPRTVTEARLPVAALMYDVIPYRDPDRYQVRDLDRRLAGLRAALSRTTDAMLAISQFSADTAAEELAYPRERIVSIGAGVDGRFVPSTVLDRPWPTRILPAGTGPFVVSVVGGDDRKNTARLVEAWSLLPPEVRSEHRLVLVAAHTPELLARWSQLAANSGVVDEVLFTGAVTDAEMVALLQRAALAVMPSIDEGFGLPVLEAAACGCPAICSSGSALPEVLDEPAACFDPFDPVAIAAAITAALTDPELRVTLRRAGERAALRWKWDAVAGSAVDALSGLGARWPGAPVRSRRAIGLMGPDDEAIRAVARVEGRVVRFVDTAGSSVLMPAGANRWPARSLDHFVKPWDVDELVAVLDASVDRGLVELLLGRTPLHLWLRDVWDVWKVSRSPELHRVRSLIVGRPTHAEIIRTARPNGPPVLVLPDSETDVWTVDHSAAALLDWLDRVHDLPAGTVHLAGPDSP